MENGTEHNDDNHDELSPLLLVPMDEAKSGKKSRGGKRLVVLLLLVSATAAAAAMTVLLNGSSGNGVHPLVSSFSALVGTRHHGKQGDWCDGFWYDACGDRLSCFMGGNSNYCVPMGKENACCGYSFTTGLEARGIDCLPGLSCDDRNTYSADTVYTCHPSSFFGSGDSTIFAKKGSCNVNTGEPANILIDVKK